MIIDKEHKKPFKPAGKTTTFVIRVEGDTVNVWLNDDLMIEDQKVAGLGNTGNNRLAIGAKYWWSGATLVYQNLEIEKLEPEE